jgi:hypothetical protein
MLVAIAENLEDMPARALCLAFEHFEKYHVDEHGRVIPVLPAPAELRHVGMDLYRKEQDAKREGSVADEMRALAKRKQEHPEEFATEEDVRQLIRKAFHTAPGEQRTTPAEEAALAATTKRTNQAKKVALHKHSKKGE